MDWFKFYGKDFLVDPKRKRLGVVHQLMWVMLLCHASDTDDGTVRYVGEYELAMDCMLTPLDDEYEHVKGFYETLSTLNMVEVIDENTVRVINYVKRQSTNLSDAERAKRYRENKKQSDDRNTPSRDERHARLDKSRVDKNRINTYTSSAAASDAIYTKDFEKFWNEYPRKVGKGAAYKAWEKIKNRDSQKITDALKLQREQVQWKKDNGQYIPNCSTWLNQRRWEDEVVAARKVVSFS